MGFQACLNTNCASNRLHRAGIPHVQSRLASPTPDIPLQSGQNPDLPRTCLGVSKADSFPSTIHQFPLRGGKGWPTLGPFQLQKLVGETISYHSGGLKNPSPGETPKGGLGDRECGHKTEARGHSFTHPPLANSPQHSGSTYPWAKTFFLSESSFLAQREPGLKPRSRWGSECGRERKPPFSPTRCSAALGQAGLSAASAGSKLSPTTSSVSPSPWASMEPEFPES